MKALRLKLESCRDYSLSELTEAVQDYVGQVEEATYKSGKLTIAGTLGNTNMKLDIPKSLQGKVTEAVKMLRG